LQVMTLEGWSTEIVNPILEKHPWALLYFLPFIVLTSFAILNLFIGIIVESMQREATKDSAAAQLKTEDYHEDILSEVRDLRAEISRLRGGTAGQSGEADRA